MKNLFLFTLTAAIVFTSCNKERLTGSGATVTEERNVDGFTRVSTNGSTNLHVSQGPFRVRVQGYENLVPYMQTKRNGSTLEIGYNNSVVNVKNNNVEVYVTLPVLESVNTNGSGNVDVSGGFTGTDLKASISGAGNIDIADGSVPQFTSTISGSGNVRAFGLTAQRADVSISGSGDTEVKAVNNLRVRISGSGTVYYRGQPAIDTEVSGSGKLIHKP